MKILPGLLLCGLISAVEAKKNLRDTGKYRCAACDMTSVEDTFLNFDSTASDDSQSSSDADESTKCPIAKKPKKCANGCFLQQDIEGKTVEMGCISDSTDEVQSKFGAMKDNFSNSVFECGEAAGTLCLICRDKKKSGDATARCNAGSEKLVLTTTVAPTTTTTTTTTTIITTTAEVTTTTKESVVVPDVIETDEKVKPNDKKACDPTSKAPSSFNRGSLSSARTFFVNHKQKVKSEVPSSSSIGYNVNSWPSLLTILALALILD